MLKDIGKLAIDCGIEYSIKATQARLDTHRWLTSFSIDDFDILLPLLKRWKCPLSLQAMLQEAELATHVHVGGDQRPNDTFLIKLYFEYKSGAKYVPSGDEPHFMAYKWKVQSPSKYHTCSYNEMIFLSSQDAAARWQECFQSIHAQTQVYAILKRLTDWLHSCAPSASPQYLFVKNLATHRCSIDVNLYDTLIDTAFLANIAEELASVLSFNTVVKTDLVNRISSTRPGHFAAGVGHHGAPFLTYYFDRQPLYNLEDL